MTKLAELTTAWAASKAAEKKAQDERLNLEIEIYKMVQDQLPDKGTFTTESGMKIVTGFTEKWDQDVLNNVYNKWNANVPFPFKGEWKPDGKALSYIRENLPHAYKDIEDALTMFPRKPSFSVKGEE